jgi:protein-tyrosine phosphatase
MTNEQMDDILRAINEQTQAGQKIYIHCQFGRDRTSAVVSSWRLAHQVPYAEAHADLARHFSYNPRTSGAERVVDFLAQRVDHIVDGVNF